jgi:DNA-binding winged helix-turn-helix (wHTH) protein
MQTKPPRATDRACRSSNKTTEVLATGQEIGAPGVVQEPPPDGFVACDAGVVGPDLKHGFRLGPWEVRPLRGEIRGAEETLHLEPKVMEVLLVLARRSEEVVERDDLLRLIWTSRGAVSDEPLTRCIKELRRALKDSRQTPAYIQTIPKRGYRLLVPVMTLVTDDGPRLYTPSREPGNTHVIREQSIPENSIAVLPFSGGSASADLLDFGGDIAGEIRSRLLSGKNVLVVARTWSDAVGGSRDLRTLQAQLRVARVLEGRVQRHGDRVRIRVDLWDAQRGYLIWSESFEDTMTTGSCFAIQDGIANAIVKKLGESLASSSSPTFANGEATGPTERRRGKDRRQGRELVTRDSNTPNAWRAPVPRQTRRFARPSHELQKILAATSASPQDCRPRRAEHRDRPNRPNPKLEP